MAPEDSVTRRVGAGRKPDILAVDTVHGSQGVNTSFQLNPWTKRRRRRVSSSRQQPCCGLLKHRPPPFLRRNSGIGRTSSISMAGLPVVVFILSCALVIHVVVFFSTDNSSSLEKNPREDASHGRRIWIPRKVGTVSPFMGLHDQDFAIIYKNGYITPFGKSYAGLSRPKPMYYRVAKAKDTPDYGGLSFELLKTAGAERIIFRDDYLYDTDFRPPDVPWDDDTYAYYADDDYIKRAYGVTAGGEIQRDSMCRKVTVHKLHFPTCNSFHELPMLENEPKYLNEGAYRQVVGLNHSFGQEWESFIIKDIQYKSSFDMADREYTRIDALVAERLTASERIYDIYGHCGIGIMSEFFPHGDVEDTIVPGEGYLTPDEIRKGALRKLTSYNNFTSREKLVMSLQMSEAVADLHGYEYGVIVHQDIQPSQFLWTKDKSRVKLNDFNRAEFMLWDESAQRYCKYGEGRGHGNWRSPEEYYDWNLDEKVDVYSLANNMYSILTGLWVFYDEPDYSKMQKRLKNGETAYIDPRYKASSLEESKLAEIIEKCHAFKPEDRPSVFEVVEFLREALREALEADSKQVKVRRKNDV